MQKYPTAYTVYMLKVYIVSPNPHRKLSAFLFLCEDLIIRSFNINLYFTERVMFLIFLKEISSVLNHGPIV